MSSKKEILNNEEFVKVIEEDRKRKLFSHYDFYPYDPEN